MKFRPIKFRPIKFRPVKFSQWVLKLHGWMGIVMGLLLMVAGLTGSVIVFQEELDHGLNRSLWSVMPQAEKISLDTMLAPVEAAHPNLPVQFIQVPKEPSESYVFSQQMAVGQRLQTFVNP